MNDRIEDASSRVSDNVGSNGNSGNNGLIYRTSAFREAEERRAVTAADLHRWLAEDRMGQTVSVREVQQRGPLSIRRLGAKRIRETLRQLQSQGMVKAGPVATGTGVPASAECWIVEADDNIVDSLLLFDLGNDALIAISETLGDERDLIGKVLASALWQWAHPDAGQPQETSRRTAHVLAAVQSGVA